MNSKIWLVTKREYFQRVRSKGFIVATILGPIGMVALITIPILITFLVRDTSTRTIAVHDETAVIFERLIPPGEYDLHLTDAPVDSLRGQVQSGELDGYLLLPEGTLRGTESASFYSMGTGGMSLRFELQSTLRQAVREVRVHQTGAPDEVLAIMQADVPMRMIRLTEAGEAADTTAIMAGIGYVMGFVIYFCVFIYGSLVMSGVIEEKTNRIVEVMASSLKPFQLMMGKVLGIGAMGLTQFIIWVAAAAVLFSSAGTLTMLFLDPAAFDLPDTAGQEAVLEAAGIALPDVPVGLLFYFIVFFLGGFLLYASLFAAVGSAVEKESDAQQLTLPVSLPVIIPIFFIFHIVDSPDSTLSVILSMVPFFSPILMVVRIAVTVVPFWQIFLSILLLVVTFVGAIWISSRIYRVGILMYGKRPSFKDLARWARSG